MATVSSHHFHQSPAAAAARDRLATIAAQTGVATDHKRKDAPKDLIGMARGRAGYHKKKRRTVAHGLGEVTGQSYFLSLIWAVLVGKPFTSRGLDACEEDTAMLELALEDIAEKEKEKEGLEITAATQIKLIYGVVGKSEKLPNGRNMNVMLRKYETSEIFKEKMDAFTITLEDQSTVKMPSGLVDVLVTAYDHMHFRIDLKDEIDELVVVSDQQMARVQDSELALLVSIFDKQLEMLDRNGAGQKDVDAAVKTAGLSR